MTKTAIITFSGGVGRRFSMKFLKQLAPYSQNLFKVRETLEVFEEVKEIDLIIITCPPNQNSKNKLNPA